MIPEFTSSYWIFTMLPVRRLGHNPVLVRPIQQGGGNLLFDILKLN